MPFLPSRYYTDISVRNQYAALLKEECELPIEIVQLRPADINLESIIQTFPSIPRRCFEFLDIEAAFPQILGYVNLRRELIMQLQQSLVFWIREEGLRRLAEDAPDFWAWRSNVFDFRKDIAFEFGSTGTHDAVIGGYSESEIQSQVTDLEKSQRSDVGSLIALGRRQFALRQYSQSEKVLQEALDQALSEAERTGNKASAAESLLLLANIKEERNLFAEARALYIRGLEYSKGARRDELKFAALRSLSALEQRMGDSNKAHQLALEMLDAAQNFGDPNALAGAYDQFGTILFSENDLRGAEVAYVKATEFERRLNHKTDLAFTLAQLGRVYIQMGSAAKARTVLEESQALFNGSGNRYGFSMVDDILKTIEPIHR